MDSTDTPAFQLRLIPDSVDLEPTEEGSSFTARFTQGDGARVDIALSREQVLLLARACKNHLPAFAPELEQAERELSDNYRRLARDLTQVPDADWRNLLREIPTDTLLAFLWFMKDRQLIKRALNNLSHRAAELMLNDLESTWGNRDPDQVPEAIARQGREAVEAVVAAWRSLHS